MSEHRVVAEGLRFPEGPVWMPDGRLLVVEIARGTLTAIAEDGSTSVVAEVGGGPNGAAVGPDGTMWITNNGGYFDWLEADGVIIPGPTPESYTGGSLQQVDLTTGAVETVATATDAGDLVAPNDLVFDADGGCWFTDHGVQGGEHTDRPGLCYAAADGAVRGVVYGLDSANGVGLSPDGRYVYVAETHSGRVWAFNVIGPGRVDSGGSPGGLHGGRLLFDAEPGVLFDSLAVDADGWVCVATIGPGGITLVHPDLDLSEHVEAPDGLTTNICFGGEDLRTGFITCSSTGVVVAVEWSRPGLRLAY